MYIRVLCHHIIPLRVRTCILVASDLTGDRIGWIKCNYTQCNHGNR